MTRLIATFAAFALCAQIAGVGAVCRCVEPMAAPMADDHACCRGAGSRAADDDELAADTEQAAHNQRNGCRCDAELAGLTPSNRPPVASVVLTPVASIVALYPSVALRDDTQRARAPPQRPPPLPQPNRAALQTWRC